MGSLGDYTGGNEERIYVSVRLRPLNVSEIYRNDVSDWECINDDTIVYKNACLSASERCMYPTLYTYDRVFGSECTTREVYEKGARDVAISVLHGMNSTIFAYGQTSSGKTYTMTGITEYALADIYEYIRKNPDRDFVLKFSAMEIYNESVRDLLSMDSTPLRLLDDPERGTVVEKLTEEVISDWSHVIHLLSVSKAQRQIGETFLNEMSSRSHQIIRLTIESSSQDSRSSLTASVNFVDLAGSERASQSYSAGTRLKEGCHINRSLLTLGTVIRKLSKGRAGHIPYRDSKLTRILQTSLGGNARTAIICTMSPARSHVEQSRNTLLFASCAKEVITSAQVNVVMSDKALVKCLQKKVEKLEDELRSSQSTYVSANFTAFLRERDLQIEKLEADIKELVLQRDIAQSKVRDMLQILEGNTRLSEQVGFDHYPHFRVVRSTDSRIEETETSRQAAPCSSFVDTRAYYDEHGDISSNIGTAKVSYAHENLVVISPRMSASSSSISESYSFNGWDETEKQSDVSSEDMCKEVRCIETADAEESDSSCSKEESYRYPQEFVSGALESLSTLEKGYEQSSSRNARERNTECETENQEDLHSPLLEETKAKLIHLLETPVGNRLINEIDRDSSIHGKQESILDSASSLFKMDLSDNTPSFDTERAQKHFEREPTPVSSCSNFQSPATKNLQFSPESDVHTQIVGPSLKLWDMEDVNGSNKETAEVLTEQQLGEIIIQPRIDHPTNKNTKDVSLDPIEEGESASSWDIAFKTLQQEIIELWHACKVSLTHRTYFFLLFQGDASDSAYLEVEQRRMKFLKNKLSAGETIFFNRKMITLTSSEKALHEERKMLCWRMSKKLCEQERETLFLKWGISLNSKHRRLQLAQCLWDQPKDMDHVLDSALLVAKLMNFVAPAVATNKEMLGIDFTLNKLPTTFRFKRGIISLP